MINLLEQINKYIEEGYNDIYASAKVAQDIILSYLFNSKYKNNITIKGGVVMFNLTNDKRRATIDIDIDLIRVYLENDNLYKIFSGTKLNGIEICVDNLNNTELKHQEYKRKRNPITIKDTFNNEITTKIDVGVHTEYNILQDEICFDTCVEKEKIKLLVNSKEQIFVEKIIPIIKFGNLSTRYKDFYDLYWLIVNGDLNKENVIKIMDEKIFNYKINNINNMLKVIELIENILSNKRFLEKLNDRKNNWIEIDNDNLKKIIIDYLESLIVVKV